MSVHHCDRCDARDDAPEDGMPLAWSIEVVDGGVRRLCAGCTRAHARDIEAKLDESWW